MKAKIISMLAMIALLLVSMVSVSAIEGIQMDNLQVELDGEEISAGTNLVAIKKGETLPVKVCFVPTQDVNAHFNFVIVGGEYRPLDVEADTGKNMFYKAGVRDCAEAVFKISDRVEIGEYTLRVFAFDKASSSQNSVVDYTIYVTGEQDEVVFEKLSMPDSVMAGRMVNPKVFLRNNGREDEERVDVQAELRSLSGAVIAKSNIVSVENLEVNEGNKPSEEMQLEIPESADAGMYEVVFTASYDNDWSADTYVAQLEVEECIGMCAGKVVSASETDITVGTNAKEVTSTGKVVYPIAVKNEGSRSVTYTVKVEGADFAVAEVQPTNFFTVEAGKSKDVNVVLTPKAGADLGDHEFSVVIMANEDVVAQESLVATIVPGAASWTSVKNGLQIGFIVLLVLLVILALIVTLNRFKGNESDDDEDLKGQTYY